MFDPLQKFIPKVADKYNFPRQLTAIQICQEYRSLAPKILPEGVLEQTFPKSYEKKTLTIGVYNTMWSEQINMKKYQIQEMINQKYGKDTVKNLRIEMSEEFGEY